MIGAPEKVMLLGTELDALTSRGAVERVAAALERGEGGWVITPNLDILRRLVRDRGFEELARGATLKLADGMPLIWASRLRRTPLPERVAGSDLIWALCERAAAEGRSVFLLGGNPGAAEKAGAVLGERYPGLRLAGVACPPPGFERDEAYLTLMEARLRAARPDIVFVGLGCPKQERLIRRLRGVLPGAWFLGIGVTFSFVSGEIRRAPRWMRRAGLEWCHRLAQEPGRLARRYLLHGLPFAAELLVRSAVAGLLGSRARRSSVLSAGAQRRG